MSDSHTVELQAGPPEAVISATGPWSENCTRRPVGGLNAVRLGPIAGLVISLLASPATAMVDVWFAERRRRDIASTVIVFQEAIGRPVSRAEALHIARQILERAERERLKVAEFEAARGIRWEEEA